MALDLWLKSVERPTRTALLESGVKFIRREQSHRAPALFFSVVVPG